MGIRSFIFALTFCVFQTQAQSQPIRTIAAQEPGETSHQYYLDLLETVLERTASEFGPAHLEMVPHPGQGRVIRFLSQNRFYDVMWTGASKVREENLLVIPVPVLKGGLGIRGLVIREQDRAEFRAITDLSQLQSKVGCQGEHWPDAGILEYAGLTVARISSVTAMMKMVLGKRCDYLALSLLEGHTELAARHPDISGLVFEDQVLLKYPLTMHYFVHQSNQQLAKRISIGLTQMVDEGALEAFMQQHPVTRHVFPLSRYQRATVFELQNPDFSQSRLLNTPRYWLSFPGRSGGSNAGSGTF